MKNKLLILVLCLLPIRIWATTVEEQQRFLYYFYEGEHLWQDQNHAGAFILFDFCHTLCPNDAITNRYMGHFCREHDYVDEALKYYHKAWKQAPKECWKDFAITLFNTKMPANQQLAIQVMEQTSQLIGHDTDLLDHLRDAYLVIQRPKQALKIQDQIDKIDGYDAYSVFNHYRIYVMMNQSPKAIQIIEQYLEEDPTNLQFHLYRMELYEATNRSTKELESIYQTILQLDPFNAQALNSYASFLASRNQDLKLAEKMSMQAIQAEPQNYVYLDTYAWILYLNGQTELAKLYMRQVIKNCPHATLPKQIQQHYNIINQK